MWSKYISNQQKTGDVDKFYFHPKIVQKNWSLHYAGVGVFTIKLFERENKEANNTINHFNNKEGNIAQQIMKCLLGILYKIRSLM